MGLLARPDLVHAKMGVGGASNLEHLPVFRTPRYGGLGPRKNADPVHPKKLLGKGTNNTRTDIATTRPSL